MSDKMNDCINELKNIFKYESINKKEDFINWGWTEKEFNKIFKNALFIVNCEYMPYLEEDIIILHYDLNYCGSPEFLNILNKYNLIFDWVDSCSAAVYYNELFHHSIPV